ncbi:hypothetical protein [uncultured Kordia sp.]|uniref:hypothetical protein n=1 Tax=uncultured Kordia sp. TaxID=507699 RepID=UPI002629E90E|nr:hypothetical protein [uncultured Kordia sp.]
MKYIKITTCFMLFLFATNCISLKKAPEVNASGYIIAKGKKLKKSLSNANHFVFYNHLYDSDLTAFIEYKLKAEENSFLQNLPVNIKETNFLMTFYTVASSDKSINLLKPFVNKAINEKLNTDFSEDVETKETEYYYVAVYVESDLESDSLKEESIHRKIVENYLIGLMNEYQSIGSSKELNFIIGNN